MSSGNWCLIESDPGVFSELIRGFGVSGVQVEEMWSLEEGEFEKLEPVHGLVFLFKWRPDEKVSGTLVSDSRKTDFFFAKQVIMNACATQAILSVLLNCNHPDVDLGQNLTRFKEFTSSMDPSLKGLSLTNSSEIREVHNSFARQQTFEFDPSVKDKDDAFHFVSYLPIDGRLYELDGLKEGPIDHGSIGERSWFSLCREVLQKRIESFKANEIHFNLMAIVSDQRMLYAKLAQKLEEDKAKILQDLEVMAKGEDPRCAELRKSLERIEEQISGAKLKLEAEAEKVQRYQIENIRRKHNYVPLIMELLKILAQKKELVPLMKKSIEKVKSKREAAKESAPVS
ncbi:ubiquitin carboxyl-terminal hydrolase isozyme L5-like [Oscarella lobularis]|uniref:ubiquitin carboxyl-terminal hydrolase isozyme L5-like n=1 Tax=Oscarella lobularis TaxID=121494 RepID=UPI003313D63C